MACAILAQGLRPDRDPPSTPSDMLTEAQHGQVALWASGSLQPTTCTAGEAEGRLLVVQPLWLPGAGVLLLALAVFAAGLLLGAVLATPLLKGRCCRDVGPVLIAAHGCWVRLTALGGCR